MKHDWLIEARTRANLTRAQLAGRARTTPRIIFMLEDDEDAVTHPKTARRIVRALGMGPEEWKTIVPSKYHNRPPAQAAPEAKPATTSGFTGYNVEIIDLDGNVLGRFSSQRAAAQFVGRSPSYIKTGVRTGEVQITDDHVQYKVRRITTTE